MENGTIVRIEGDTENNEYAVRGYDPVSNRMWLAITCAEYDGYNGDLIVSPHYSGGYGVCLLDDRANLPFDDNGRIQLTVV